MPWGYVRTSNRYKHAWNKPHAGFQMIGGVEVSFCANTISMALAEQLLNAGVPYFHPKAQKPYPHYIFNIYDGAVYKARITVGGASYHGHPCRAREIPPIILADILNLAVANGSAAAVNHWLQTYP